MGYGRKKSASSPETEAPALPDYHATGEGISPDCRCNYFEAGIHEGQKYFTRSDGQFLLWWDGVGEWQITHVSQGFNELPNGWSSPLLPGTFSAHGEYSGFVEVLAGGH